MMVSLTLSKPSAIVIVTQSLSVGPSRLSTRYDKGEAMAPLWPKGKNSDPQYYYPVQLGRILRGKGVRPLLDYALRPNIVTPTKLPQFVEFVDFDMVCLLVDKGAKPTEKFSIYGNITVWALFLLSCYEKKDIQNVEAKETWFKVAELMIRKGADRKLKLETTRREKVVISSEAERSELMKTAKYRTSVSRGGMVDMDVLVVLTAVGILREIFGDGKMAEIEAIEPEVTSWSVWNWIHWT